MTLTQAIRNGVAYTRLNSLQEKINSPFKDETSKSEKVGRFLSTRIHAVTVALGAAFDAISHGPALLVKNTTIRAYHLIKKDVKASVVNAICYAVATPFMLLTAIFSPKSVVALGRKFKIIDSKGAALGSSEGKKSWGQSLQGLLPKYSKSSEKLISSNKE